MAAPVDKRTSTLRQRWRDAVRDSTDPTIDVHTIAVAMALDRYMTGDGRTWVGVRKLAARARVHPSTVTDRAQRLEAAGWLTVQWPERRGLRTVYHATIPGEVSHPVEHPDPHEVSYPTEHPLSDPTEHSPQKVSYPTAQECAAPPRKVRGPTAPNTREHGYEHEGRARATPQPPTDTAATAYALIADQRPGIHDRSPAYIRATIAGIRTDHHQRAHELLHAHPDLTPEALAHHLETGTTPNGNGHHPSPWSPDPYRPLPPRPTCTTCSNVGMILNDDAEAIPCPDCTTPTTPNPTQPDAGPASDRTE